MKIDRVSETHTVIATRVARQNNHGSKKTPRSKMDKYVLICVVGWLLFVATFPLAYLRVWRSEKYTSGPFKSLTLEESQKTNGTAVTQKDNYSK
ncbi:MAG: hypothetical protein AB4426_13800 [Xenococcaceae cyanobacterium]